MQTQKQSSAMTVLYNVIYLPNRSFPCCFTFCCTGKYRYSLSSLQNSFDFSHCASKKLSSLLSLLALHKNTLLDPGTINTCIFFPALKDELERQWMLPVAEDSSPGRSPTSEHGDSLKVKTKKKQPTKLLPCEWKWQQQNAAATLSRPVSGRLITSASSSLDLLASAGFVSLSPD